MVAVGRRRLLDAGRRRLRLGVVVLCNSSAGSASVAAACGCCTVGLRRLLLLRRGRGVRRGVVVVVVVRGLLSVMAAEVVVLSRAKLREWVLGGVAVERGGVIVTVPYGSYQRAIGADTSCLWCTECVMTCSTCVGEGDVALSAFGTVRCCEVL